MRGGGQPAAPPGPHPKGRRAGPGEGSLNLYLAGGTLTLAVTHCLPTGAGDLQSRLLQLEAELRLEGLFDRPKRPLPRWPRRIGCGGAARTPIRSATSNRKIGRLVRPGQKLCLVAGREPLDYRQPGNLLGD